MIRKKKSLKIKSKNEITLKGEDNMKNNLKKKLTVSTAIGILVVGSCFPSFAAGTKTKTVDGIRVTATSSVSGRTATASTERTKAGTVSVYMYYEYKQTNSNIIGTGTRQDTSIT